MVHISIRSEQSEKTVRNRYSNNDSDSEDTRPIECDVGKLKNDHVDLQQPSRDNKYRLLIIFLMKINRERCSNLVSELVKRFVQLQPRMKLSFMLQE